MTSHAPGSSATFSCPQCGVPLDPRQADCFLTCDYCGNSLFLDLDALLRVTTLTPAISAQEAPLHVRRHLAEYSLEGALTVRDQELAYMPFWLREGMERLERASALFPVETLEMPDGPQQVFLPEHLPSGSVIHPVDTQPETGGERRLIYLPIHRITVDYRGRRYIFLCNAVTGTVTGPSIPREEDQRMSRLFRLFMALFLSALIVDMLVDTPWVLLTLNGILFFLAFQISLPWIEGRLYR